MSGDNATLVQNAEKGKVLGSIEGRGELVHRICCLNKKWTFVAEKGRVPVVLPFQGSFWFWEQEKKKFIAEGEMANWLYIMKDSLRQGTPSTKTLAWWWMRKGGHWKKSLLVSVSLSSVHISNDDAARGMWTSKHFSECSRPKENRNASIDRHRCGARFWNVSSGNGFQTSLCLENVFWDVTAVSFPNVVLLAGNANAPWGNTAYT